MLRSQLTLVCSPTGVSSYDISLEKQEVIVKTTVDYDTILAKIKKTGKEVTGGERVDVGA